MTERLVDRLRHTYERGHPLGRKVVNPDGPEAANVIEKLEETLHAARGIIVEDAEACRAFRHESEGLSGPENVLTKIDDALSLLRGEAL